MMRTVNEVPGYRKRMPAGSVSVLVLFVLIVLIAGGCGEERMGEAGVGADAGVLRVAVNDFPDCLNPLYTTGETGQCIINKIFDSLYKYDENGNLAKGLVAEEEPGSCAGVVYLRLRRNVRFSSGKELDAHDVVATYVRVTSPYFLSPYREVQLSAFQIEAVDRYRLKVTIHDYFAVWRHYLTIKVLSRPELDRWMPIVSGSGVCTGGGDNGPSPIDTVMVRRISFSGTGPYCLVRSEPNRRVLLKRNPFFDHPHGTLYDTLSFDVLDENGIIPAKLLGGETDICPLSAEVLTEYKHNERWRRKFRLFTYGKFGYTYIAFNLRNRNIDKRVRRIFYHCLVTRGLCRRLIGNIGEPVWSPFLFIKGIVRPECFSVDPLPEVLTLRLLVNSKNRLLTNMAFFLKRELESYNIDLCVQLRESASLLAAVKASDYDVAFSGYLLDMDCDMSDVMAGDSYYNYTGYKSEEMDRLLSAGIREQNSQAREAIYLRAHRVWAQELPFIPLFKLHHCIGVSSRVKIPGKLMRIVGGESDYLFNITDWTVK